MIAPFVILVMLAAEPAVSGASQSAAEPAESEVTSEPSVELLIPQEMIEEFLVAATPYTRIITRDVNVLGFSKKVQLNLRLTEPKVKVTEKGVFVTFAYDVRGPAGTSARGRATPQMELRIIKSKGIVEGRLTGAKLSAAGGVDVPMDDLIEPLRFPAATSGPLVMGDTKLEAKIHATDVVLETGNVRVKGRWSFAPGAATVADDSVK